VAQLRRLVIVAGEKSHPPGMHEYRAGALLLARCLTDVPDLVVDVYDHGRLPAPAAADVSAIVVFSDGGVTHPVFAGDGAEALDALVRAGVGVGAIHWALEAPSARGATRLTDWVGGSYVDGVSCNPIWEADVERLPEHPITRGVSPFAMTDEWYFNLAFDAATPAEPTTTADGTRFSPILVATPSDAVRTGPYVWPAGPYAHVVAASGRPETLMWAIERPNGGRGFGFTGGHFHANWAHDDLRRVVLDALVWVTGADVPMSGVASSVTPADLERDLDDPA
jgi:Trehalose utilisation